MLFSFLFAPWGLDNSDVLNVFDRGYVDYKKLINTGHIVAIVFGRVLHGLAHQRVGGKEKRYPSEGNRVI